jgi:Cytochrome C'
VRWMWTSRVLTAAVAATVAGVLLVAPTTAKDPLPDGTAAKVVAADIEYLTAGFAEKPTAKGALAALKGGAMLLALTAQNGLDGKDADKMAAVRAQALKVAEALAAKKPADAAAAAAGLAAAKGGDKKPLKLHEQAGFDLAELMSAYRSSKAGAMNIEADLKAADKAIKDVALVEVQTARVALIAQYSLDMPPGGAESGAKRKQWDDLAKESMKLGLEASAEAAKGAKADQAKLKKAVGAILLNCASCHKTFRDN